MDDRPATILEALSGLLATELGAINQYMVHAEICENWGHDRLAQAFEARTAEEMRHVRQLVARILALGGRPGLGTPAAQGAIGGDVAEQLRHDLRTEESVARAYESALEVTAGDVETGELLAGILAEERRHVAWLRGELDRIESRGLARYLEEMQTA